MGILLLRSFAPPLCCLCVLLGTSLIVLASIAIWFVFPRGASVELARFKVSDFFVTPPQNLSGGSLPDYRLRGDATMSVHNPNYATIFLDELNLDVKWRDTVLSQVSTSDKEFPGLRNQTMEIPVEISSSSTPVTLSEDTLLLLAHTFLSGSPLTLSFEGNAAIKYLGIPVTVPVQFQHDIDTQGLLAPFE